MAKTGNRSMVRGSAILQEVGDTRPRPTHADVLFGLCEILDLFFKGVIETQYGGHVPAAVAVVGCAPNCHQVLGLHQSGSDCLTRCTHEIKRQ